MMDHSAALVRYGEDAHSNTTKCPESLVFPNTPKAKTEDGDTIITPIPPQQCGPALASKSSKTFRISNIPTELTIDDIKGILGSTACDIELLAPSTNETEGRKKNIALAVFSKIPHTLAAPGAISIPIPPELAKRVGLRARKPMLYVDTRFLGLTPLNETPENEADIKMECVISTGAIHFHHFTDYRSVIAVTGLGGHAFGSWKARNHDYMWLQDSLPEDVSGLRVLTYGYDTALVGSDSFTDIPSLAKDFLLQVKCARTREAVSIHQFSSN